MRVGRWLIIGKQAGTVWDAARHMAKAESRRANLLEQHRLLRLAHEEERKNHRQALADKEQLKGVLRVVSPQHLAEVLWAWKNEGRS